MHNTWFLTFTERKDNQTSNKLNTIAIPLAATPLCMLANIVLVLSLGGVIFPQILFILLSVLIKLYYIRYTIISSTFVKGGAQANGFALPPLICLVMFSTWCVAVISLSILKQMVVNQNLQLRVNKRLLVCLSLYGGGMNNY